MTYHNENDYMLPDIKMDVQYDGAIGKYGTMRKQYLMENQNTKFQTLLICGTLYSHLMEIENTARDKIETLVNQMKQSQGITESMKVNDQMAWVKAMNIITFAAEEIIITEMIYT